MITFDQLFKWSRARAAMEIEYGARSFMKFPTEWLDDPHFFCQNGHVSGTILKCDEDGDLCLECHKPVVLGPRIGETKFAKEMELISW